MSLLWGAERERGTMPSAILDVFTDLGVSRQRRYQLRKAREGKCAKCGRPSQGMSRCLECAQVEHYQRGGKRFNGKRIKAKRERLAKAQAKANHNPWVVAETVLNTVKERENGDSITDCTELLP